MINYEMMFALLGLIIGCGITLYVYIEKKDRPKQLDLWLGMALFFLLGYKLVPIIDSPQILLRPLQLLILKSGDLGLLLGFLLALLYWVYVQIKQMANFVESFSQVLIAIVCSYSIVSLLTFEVYQDHYLGMYRIILGVVSLLMIKFKPIWVLYLLLFYGGVLLVIESLAFAHLYWGFSLIQWLILFILLFYIVMNMLLRKGRLDWQEK